MIEHTTPDFSGTRAPAGRHAFDVPALETHLRHSLPGFAGPLAVEQFKGGQSNPTYKLVTPQAAYVMRSKPAPRAQLLPSAHAIEREVRVMRALSASEVPVPRVHLLCEDESVIGRAFYVMDLVEGRVLWEPSLPGMEPSERAAIHDAANRVIAALHRVDPASVGLADYGKPGNYFGRQIERWIRQYRASETQPIVAMDHLIEWLPASIPVGARESTHSCIVHGDFRIDNLVFHPCKPVVLAVLDWELSTLGHPLADFSYHCMAWHMPHTMRQGLGGLDLAALGIPSEHDYVRRYCDRTNRAGSFDAVMADWNFYMAYNLFRLAAILQGVAKRALDGTAASALARESGSQAPALAKLGWQFAQAAHD